MNTKEYITTRFESLKRKINKDIPFVTGEVVESVASYIEETILETTDGIGSIRGLGEYSKTGIDSKIWERYLMKTFCRKLKDDVSEIKLSTDPATKETWKEELDVLRDEWEEWRSNSLRFFFIVEKGEYDIKKFNPQAFDIERDIIVLFTEKQYENVKIEILNFDEDGFKNKLKELETAKAAIKEFNEKYCGPGLSAERQHLKLNIRMNEIDQNKYSEIAIDKIVELIENNKE